MAKPSDAQLEFTLRLFDLNGDQTLTTDEMLTSLALDAVVSDQEGARRGILLLIFTAIQNLTT